MGVSREFEKLFGPWPTSRKIARALSARSYHLSKPCKHGHDTYRLTSTGKCYSCELDQWARSRIRIGKVPFQPATAKATARKMGEKYYEGATCPQGHDGKRWTHNGACVECTIAASRAYFKTTEGRDYIKSWRARNSEKTSNNGRNQKAKRRLAVGIHTAADVRSLIARQKYKCIECFTSIRQRKNRHVDHIMPLAKGGTNWPDNLQILCPTCNMSKGALHPLEFARRKGRLL